MKILMLTWEYPPRSVGGLARHVEDLASAIARSSHEIHVVTPAAPEAPDYEKSDGVHIHRFEPYPVETSDFLTWILQINLKMLERIAGITAKEGAFDIVHAHDWLVAFAGGGAKHAYQIPLVATIHATEAGRNHGLHTDQQRYISGVEWWLAYEAWKIIVCSSAMKSEIKSIFDVPRDKVEVLPNGVNAEKFESAPVEPGFRNRFARDDEKIVFFIGRLVREKGVHVLLESAPLVLRSFPGAKFIIAGTGPMEGELKTKARGLGLQDKVVFAGYIDDATRNKLYSVASAAVFPSLYEPFGIVALEGMAAGTPVVVSETGGLAEIVTHGKDGLKAFPGDAGSLASDIVRLLTDEVLADRLRATARRMVKENYDWEAIATKTLAVYEKILAEYRRSPWNRRRARVWQYAFSLMASRYDVPETKGLQELEEEAEKGKHYDLVNYRIAANNHREGGGQN